jgi:hypothetical protein
LGAPFVTTHAPFVQQRKSSFQYHTYSQGTYKYTVQIMTKNASIKGFSLRLRICFVATIMLPVFALPRIALAQSTANKTVLQTSASESVIPLAPFQYVPSPRWKEPDASETANRSPAQKNLADLYKDGKYAAVGSEGLALITKEKIDEQLQLFIANSLAWTGNTKQAGQLYRVLLPSKYKSEATIGLANLHRWQGKDYLALPMYKEVLKTEPDNKDATEGLRLAARETQPRTTIVLGALKDSSNIEIRSLKLNHRWADESLANVWEIETGTVQSKDATLSVTRPSLTVRYKAQDTIFKPRLEVGSDGKNLYGNVGIALGDLPVLVDIGRINWGEISSNPKALAAQLSATRLSVQTSASFSAGNLFARAEFNNISDGNSITATAIRFTPAWRPFGSHFKPLLGIETRDSKFSKLEYWSPAEGYGTAFAGMMAEWQETDWNFFASAQAGTRLYGEAGSSWSASSGGKLWLNKDWAVGLRLWSMASQRNFQRYRAKSAFITVEKLWD